MLQALTWKEIRECTGVLAVALLASVWLLANQIALPINPLSPPRMRNTVPFISDEFYTYFVLLFSSMSIILALRQSAWEIGHRTFDFLLFRPITRDNLFAIKIALGIGIVLLTSGIPILIYSFWAALPGDTPTPFVWSMTAPTWFYCLSLPTIYLGAFLSGIRPGHWFGTRLLPLVSAAAIVIICTQFLLYVWGYSACCVLLVLVDYALFRTIVYFAYTRDY